MLSGLKMRYRLKAALTLAVLHAFCVLAPHAALALTNATAHCLTEPHGAAHVHLQEAPKGHAHVDGMTHADSDTGMPHKHTDSDKKNFGGSCCGLFCVMALAQEPAPALSAPPAAAPDGPRPEYRLDGRGPEQLKVAELIRRLEPGSVKEIVIATNPTVEGEATAVYLARLLKPLGVSVSRIAHGIPVGGNLEYADQVTLGRAIEGRRQM